MAEAYDEAAEDPQVSLETRRRAQEAAYHRRDRARLLQTEAQRLGAYPTSVGGHSTQKQPPYAGSERRERERRMRDRRASGSLHTPALAHADRRGSRIGANASEGIRPPVLASGTNPPADVQGVATPLLYVAWRFHV
jgi:hypothetical protein